MKALVLSAGLGERMRPLTLVTPKPLLVAGGEPLIAWHLRKLAAIGVRDVVINTSWLAPQFPDTLGDGGAYGLHLHYTHEGDTPLETGGGIAHALPLLGEEPFIVVNGDIWTDFDFARLRLAAGDDAHLVLVDNPPQHPRGDFALQGGRVANDSVRRLTFSGMGVYHRRLFDDWRAVIGDTPGARATPPRFPLAPLLRTAMHRNGVSGEHHAGRWTDVGTPDRLAQLDATLRQATR